jgi:glycosyltransferase involved in cell wall biosynthesis
MKTARKIAFIPQPLDMIFPPTQSAIGIWIYEVASRLARSCEVIVYSGRLEKKVEFHKGVHYRRMSPVPDRYLGRLLNRFSGFYNVKRPLFASSWYYLGYVLQVANDLRKRQCDIVHIHNLSQFVPIIRAFNPNIKIVLHMHCEWLSQLNPAMIEPRLGQVDLVIGCSEHVTKEIRLALPRFASRCQTVYNGVDVNHFYNDYGHITAKAPDAKRLLFVGRISPEKGLHILVDAFHKVAMRHSEVHLEIVGPEARAPIEFFVASSDDHRPVDLAPFYEKSYLAQLQERLLANLSSHVTFSGPVPYSSLTSRYCSADVFIFPSVWNESFGMPIIEAMAPGASRCNPQRVRKSSKMHDRFIG